MRSISAVAAFILCAVTAPFANAAVVTVPNTLSPGTFVGDRHMWLLYRPPGAPPIHWLKHAASNESSHAPDAPPINWPDPSASDGSFAGGTTTIGGDFTSPFTPGGETPTVANAVPEPSTWAMMLLGLAGLGVAARRRRTARLAALMAP